MKKRIFSILLCLRMMAAVLPMGALADELNVDIAIDAPTALVWSEDEYVGSWTAGKNTPDNTDYSVCLYDENDECVFSDNTKETFMDFNDVIWQRGDYYFIVQAVATGDKTDSEIATSDVITSERCMINGWEVLGNPFRADSWEALTLPN